MTGSYAAVPAETVRDLAQRLIYDIDGERAARRLRIVERVRRSWSERFAELFRAPRTDAQIIGRARDFDVWRADVYAYEDRAVAERLLALATSGASTINVSAADWLVLRRP